MTQAFPLTLSDAGSPIAYDAVGGLLFVGCPKKPMVVVFDARTGKELAGIAISGGIDDIQFDAERNWIYASCGDNALVILDRKGDAYQVVATDTDGPEVRVFKATGAKKAQP